MTTAGPGPLRSRTVLTAPPDLGGLPPLATGITVRFDAAPADTYLTLSTEGGEVVYQKAVGEGARSFTPDLNDWRNLSGRRSVQIALASRAVLALLCKAQRPLKSYTGGRRWSGL